MKQFKWAIALVLLVAVQTSFAEYKVSDKDGSVGFSGEHAGMKFSGTFNKWSATLSLPSAPAEEGFIQANFSLKSAKTGDSIYDETLPEGDWFDAVNHPTGEFKSSSVLKSANGYEVKGTLSLRGKTLPASFALIRSGERLNASFVIDRLAYGIGLDSDPDAEWVSKDIQMTLDIPQS
ncbi:YceI family protein [Glaciecola sp. SC05]|uniref:YceI family protein n=1 Tax=Glaciecola sp. SC05 TaxID=1987355 RepID=UPI0035298F14